MNICYKNMITVSEVNSIRKSVGFRQGSPEQVEAGLTGSSYIIAAYDLDRAVGMARLIWDTGSVASIHDILVVPEYQMQGIEDELITRTLNFLRTKLKPGFGIQVDVRVWNNKKNFYESLGFQVSTPQRRGIPMHICLTDHIDLTDAMFKQMEFKEKE